MKKKKASTVGFRPAHRHTHTHTHTNVNSQFLITITHDICHILCLPPTDHEVRHTGEDDGGDGPQRDDVRQDLGQEVDRHSVVTADVLMTDGRQRREIY